LPNRWCVGPRRSAVWRTVDAYDAQRTHWTQTLDYVSAPVLYIDRARSEDRARFQLWQSAYGFPLLRVSVRGGFCLPGFGELAWHFALGRLLALHLVADLFDDLWVGQRGDVAGVGESLRPPRSRGA